MVEKSKTLSQEINVITTKYHKEFSKTSLGLLWCKLCNKKVSFSKSYSVSSHQSSQSHIKGLESLEPVDLTVPLSNAFFIYDHVKTFLILDIPLHKLRSPHFIKLLATYELPAISQSKAQSMVKQIYDEIFK